jgi:hypothetical protein
MMGTLGWQIKDAEWGFKNPAGSPTSAHLPPLQNVAQSLANMTAVLFWLGEYFNEVSGSDRL